MDFVEVGVWWILTLAAVLIALVLVRSNFRLEAENALLKAQSTTDMLTGLLNRRGFRERIEAAVGHALRTGESVALILIDLNDLKKINDGHGHALGDAVLKSLAEAMRAAAPRPSDALARLGGDEFAILLVGTVESGARIVAERLRHEVEARLIEDSSHGTFTYGVSIGGVALHFAAETIVINGCALGGRHTRERGAVPHVVQTLHEVADRYLYRAKERKAPGVCPIEIPETARLPA